MIKAMFRKFAIHLIYWIFSFPRRTKTFIDIRIFAKHKEYTVISPGVLSRKKIAVVAIYPRIGIWNSTTRLINFFFRK